MRTDPKTRAKILSNVRKLVLTKHFNIAGVDHAAWANRVLDREPELVRCDEDEFEAGVRALLAELRSSHTAFYHELPKRFPAPHTINATLSPVEIRGSSQWMFVDVFEDGPADRAGIRPGDVLFSVDEIGCTTAAAPEFGIGRSQRLCVSTAGTGPSRDIVVDVPHRKATKQRPPLVEPKPLSFRVLEGKIGLLKIVYFPGAAGIRFGRTLDSAIGALNDAGCNRLIIDLRGNIGGSLGFARLASYLCPGQEPIGYSLTPQRLRDGYDREALPRVPMPATRSALLLTLAQFAARDKSVMLMTQALGSQPFHGHVATLVNEWTSSAGEMIAAFAAENQIGILVGQRTKGNVLGATNREVGGGYWLRLPVFGWYTAQGTCLEGAGLVPQKRTASANIPATIGMDPTLRHACALFS